MANLCCLFCWYKLKKRLEFDEEKMIWWNIRKKKSLSFVRQISIEPTFDQCARYARTWSNLKSAEDAVARATASAHLFWPLDIVIYISLSFALFLADSSSTVSLPTTSIPHTHTTMGYSETAFSHCVRTFFFWILDRFSRRTGDNVRINALWHAESVCYPGLADKFDSSCKFPSKRTP